MSDLAPIIIQLEQDRIRLRDLINGDENLTVQLETRVEKSIAGQVADRINSLALDLNDAVSMAEHFANESESSSVQSGVYRDQAQQWATSVIQDITIAANGDLLITLASNQIINAGNIGDTGYAASNVLVSTNPDVFLDQFLTDLVSEVRGNTTYWQNRTTNFNATVGNFYSINLTAPLAITLPASPVVGRMTFLINSGNAALHNITIARNGQTIESLTENMVISDNFPRRWNMEWNGTTWLVYL